jgi:hypothetical protein
VRSSRENKAMMCDMPQRDAKMAQLFFGVYGAGVTLAAIFITGGSSSLVAYSEMRPCCQRCTVCLLGGLFPLSLSFLLTFGQIAFLCFGREGLWLAASHRLSRHVVSHVLA